MSRHPRRPSRVLEAALGGRFVRSAAPSRSPDPTGAAPTFLSPTLEDPGNENLCGWTPKLLKAHGALDLRWRYCQFGDLSRIHPIFHRSHFSCTDIEYDTVRRGLCLASAFLYEPAASVFWYALVFGPRNNVPHLVRARDGSMRECVEAPWSAFSAEPVGIDEMAQLNTFWEQMQHAVQFRFIDIATIPGDSCAAVTVTLEWYGTRQPGPLLAGRYRALIKISNRFLSNPALSQATTPTEGIPYALRTDYNLAVVVLHELSHAVHTVTALDQHEAEPFFEDMREAELGFAWEQIVLNGRLDPVNVGGARNAKWGLQFLTWPDGLQPHDMHLVGKFPLGDDDELIARVSRKWWRTLYLVMMEHVQDLAFQRGWGEIARYGPQRLKRQKLVGMRKGEFTAETRAMAESSAGSSALWGSYGTGSPRLVIAGEKEGNKRKRSLTGEGENGSKRKRRT
ncbi:hypothetical protein MMC08_007941 [Hypocenomyce scalaris]|nr:hypothetical protein [Hypocenomyce scalaris]